MLKKKKIVYYIGHYGGLYLSLLHKCRFHANDEALFLYVTTYGSKSIKEFVEGLTKTEWPLFGRFACVAEEEFWGMQDQGTTEKKIVDYYNSLLEHNGFNINDVDEVVIHFDEFNSIGVYLSLIKKKVFSSVIVTDPLRLTTFVDMYRFNDVSGREYYVNLYRQYSVLERKASFINCGYRTYPINNLAIKYKNLNENHLREVIDNSNNYSYFDVRQSSDEMSKAQKNEFDNLFNVNGLKLSDDKYDMVLLSANFTFFEKRTTNEQFIAFCQALVDYGSNGNRLVVKPHPRWDPGESIIKRAFVGCDYIPAYFPGEYIDSLKLDIHTFISSGSNASEYVSSVAKRVLNFDRWSVENYKIMHRIFVALDMASSFCFENFYYYRISSNTIQSFSQVNTMFQRFSKMMEIIDFKNIDDNAFILLNFNDCEDKWIMSQLGELLHKRNCCIFFASDINDFDSCEWNTTEFRRKLVTFSISKERIRDDVFSDLDEERFFIYAEDSSNRNKLRNYYKSWFLKYSGIRLETSSLNNKNMAHADDCTELLEYVGTSLDKTNQLINKWLSYNDMHIRLINDFRFYLKSLLNMNHLVIVAVKDTPGLMLTLDDAKGINEIGFKCNLHQKHWCSYIGIRRNGDVLFERLNSEGAVYYEETIMKKRVKVYSASLRFGNKVYIYIDGLDYSINMRGINIVVFDMERNVLIDSVCFDTHEREFPCYRNDVLLIK